ncbi:T9SS type A sorting domain-containing protein [Aquimarina rhabdastrellae]
MKILSIITLMAGTCCYAQHIERQVITTGGNIANSEMQLQYVIGELAVHPIQEELEVISQGFLSRPQLKVYDLSHKIEKEFTVDIWPNPVVTSLQIQTKRQDLLYMIYDVYGQQKDQGNLTDKGVNDIDFSPYPKGVYIIHLQNEEGKSTIHKIIKN